MRLAGTEVDAGTARFYYRLRVVLLVVTAAATCPPCPRHADLKKIGSGRGGCNQQTTTTTSSLEKDNGETQPCGYRIPFMVFMLRGRARLFFARLEAGRLLVQSKGQARNDVTFCISRSYFLPVHVLETTIELHKYCGNFFRKKLEIISMSSFVHSVGESKLYEVRVLYSMDITLLMFPSTGSSER